jgi:hypothetical protein
MRVELKKEIEARSRAAYAGVSSGCYGTGIGFQCSVPFESWGQLLGSGTRVKLNALGQAISRRVSMRNARGERVGVWERGAFRGIGAWERQELPLSAPPLISLEEADAPYATTPEEWAPFPDVNLDGTIVAILAGDIVDFDRAEILAREMRIQNAAWLQAFRELQISLTNPLMYMPMFTPGMGTQGIEIGWSLFFDLALTADDFIDWIGPFYRLDRRFAESEVEALHQFQADRQAAVDRATYRLLTETLNQELGLYWVWQDRQSATQPNQYEDLTRTLNRAGLYWIWQTSPTDRRSERR